MKKISTRDIAQMGVMLAVLEAVKHTLAFLPNVELVTLFIILFSLYFKDKVIYVIFAFILFEGCWYGFGLWWVMYAYAWPLLALITRIFHRQESVWFWGVVAGAYGLSFGALCAIPYLFLGGIHTAAAWWIAGIPYDIIHCISNFILCMILFIPLKKVLQRVPKRD